MNKKRGVCAPLLIGALALSTKALADEGLFGYVKGAEPLPKGAWDAEQWFYLAGGEGAGIV